MNFTISREDQCDNPSGGALRVAARILARTVAGTCSRPAPRLRSNRPATPSASYRDSHRFTVGRDTPAIPPISFFGRPPPYHNTLRAPVPPVTPTPPRQLR